MSAQDITTCSERADRPAAAPYKRHLIYSSEGGINRALCGHMRPTEESNRIIKSLGAAWNDAPRCEPCHAMRDAEREIKRARQREEKALRLAKWILQHVDSVDGLLDGDV